MSSSQDPDELVRSIERTRAELAETVDAIADRVSPKRVAARTKEQVRTALHDGAASVAAGVDVVKAKVAGPPPPVPPARPLDDGPTQALPTAAPVAVPPLDLSSSGGSAALTSEESGLPVRPEVVGGALVALVLLLLVRRRRAARRRRTGLAALLDR